MAVCGRQHANTQLTHHHYHCFLHQGTLPDSISGLTSLRELYVDGNQLEGNPLPSINPLTSLDLVYLEGNFFTGSLDATFAANWNAVRALDLSENQFTLDFTGAFPTHLLALPTLNVLDVSRNSLSGVLPDNIAFQNTIVFFSLHENKMRGTVPETLTNLGTLHHLDLSNNGFTGTLPTRVVQHAPLFQVYMAENPGFSPGPIPDLSASTQLVDISFKNTNRNGTLPLLDNFNDLHILDLDDNDLTGTIPASYGQLPALRHLLLNSNPNLGGTLPDFTTTYNLGTVFLDKTSVTGDFNSICDLPTFQGITPIDTEIIMIADCSDADSGIVCDCCHCCTKDQLICSDPDVASLDWTWEHGFARLSRDFGLDHSRLQRPQRTP